VVDGVGDEDEPIASKYQTNEQEDKLNKSQMIIEDDILGEFIGMSNLQ
jgi:hypothetical protein